MSKQGKLSNGTSPRCRPTRIPNYPNNITSTKILMLVCVALKILRFRDLTDDLTPLFSDLHLVESQALSSTTGADYPPLDRVNNTFLLIYGLD
jgi:hypothetical protein